MFCSAHIGFLEKLKLGVTLKNWNISHKISHKRIHFQYVWKDLCIWQHWAHFLHGNSWMELRICSPLVANSPIHHNLYSVLFTLLSFGSQFTICLGSMLIVSLLHTESTSTSVFPLVITSPPDLEPVSRFCHMALYEFLPLSFPISCLLSYTYSSFKWAQIHHSLAFSILPYHHHQVEWIAPSTWNNLLHVCCMYVITCNLPLHAWYKPLEGGILVSSAYFSAWYTQKGNNSL